MFGWVLSGLASALILVALILVSYRGDTVFDETRLGSGISAIVQILAVAIGLGAWRASAQKLEHAGDVKSGLAVGLVTGGLWVLEISFNNFVDSRVSTMSARFIVDNGVWGFIALVILAASFVRAIRTRKVSTGVRVGVWSGTISGLVACLMGLLLITFGMRFLLRDPIDGGEYAVRGAAEDAPNPAAYRAYETLTGAVGHLTLLGVAMGALLGAIGGTLARLMPTKTQANLFGKEPSHDGHGEEQLSGLAGWIEFVLL